jgi:hypothetical protein
MHMDGSESPTQKKCPVELGQLIDLKNASLKREYILRAQILRIKKCGDLTNPPSWNVDAKLIVLLPEFPTMPYEIPPTSTGAFVQLIADKAGQIPDCAVHYQTTSGNRVVFIPNPVRYYFCGKKIPGEVIEIEDETEAEFRINMTFRVIEVKCLSEE